MVTSWCHMKVSDVFPPFSTTTGRQKERSYNGDYMKLGREGESAVLRFLKQRPQVVGVADFRDLRVIQEADIDFAVSTRDGRVTLAEVKADSWLGTSGNLLCEVMRINHTCVPDRAGYLGWAFRSPAKWLLYYAPPSKNQIWQISFDDLRRGLQNYTREQRAQSNVKIVETDSIKTTFNILVPEKYFVDKIRIFSLDSL